MAESKSVSITIDNVTAGIGSDKYFGLKNGCYDGMGLNIKNGKKVILNTHNTNRVYNVPNNSQITKIGDILTSHNGYIYDKNLVSLYRLGSTDGYRNIRNFTNQTINGVGYRLLISTKYIHRYPISGLLTYTTLDGGGTNRTIDGSYIKHTTGSTSSFVGSSSAVSGKQYLLSFTVDNMTTGSFTITIGGASTQTITSNGTYNLNFTAINTTALTITPTSTFDGWITTTNMIGASTMEEARKTLDNTSSICPVLTDGGITYIGNGNYVYIIDILGELTYGLQLPVGDEVVGITKNQSVYFVWTRGATSSRIYQWDGVSQELPTSTYWKNEIIQSVINQGNYHIVITGGDNLEKRIYKTNGYSKALLNIVPIASWISDSTDLLLPPIPLYFNSNKNINSNNITSYGDMVYMPGYGSIIGYGHKIPGFQDSFFNEFILSNGSEEIYSIEYVDGDIYVAYDDAIDDICKVILFKLDNYNNVKDGTTYYNFGNRGYISFNPISFKLSTNKTPFNLSNGVNVPENTMVNFYYNINSEKDRFTVVVDETINPISELPTEGAIYQIGSMPVSIYLVTKVYTYLNYTFIELKETVINGTPRVNDQMIKVSGTGDTSIIFNRFHNYRILSIINKDNIQDRKYIESLNIKFNEMQPRIELITRDGQVSPEWTDFTLQYSDGSDF